MVGSFGAGSGWQLAGAEAGGAQGNLSLPGGTWPAEAWGESHSSSKHQDSAPQCLRCVLGCSTPEGADNACAAPIHTAQPLWSLQLLFLPLFPKTLDFAENKSCNWFLGKAAAAGQGPVPSCCPFHQSPVTVPRGATSYPHITGSFGAALPKGQCQWAELATAAQGPAPSPAAPGHHPCGLAVITLCHLWAPWSALAIWTMSSSPRPPPMGWFWGATVSSASPPCGAVLEQEASLSLSPAPCLRVPSPRGTGESGVSFERAPAVTGAGKGEVGRLPPL